MDKLNNNNNDNYNSFDGNFENFNMITDDICNHNNSRNTARTNPFNYTNNVNPISSLNSQEFTRANFDRMKDRQISILTQKNNILETELLAMRQKYPVLHEYSMMGQLSNGNKHLYLQIKLLSTTLNEKFEELRQTKEELRQTKKEYKLVMQERTTVHQELQEQTAEIEMLKNQVQMLEEQLNLKTLHKSNGILDTENGVYCNQLHEVLNENDTLKSEMANLESTVQELKSHNELSCMQLNCVLDKYHKLKMAVANDINLDRDFKSISGTVVNEKIVSGNVKMIDLKMVLLKIAYDRTCTTNSIINKNGGDNFLDSKSSNGAAITAIASVNDAAASVNSSRNAADYSSDETICLREGDQLLKIEETSVANWSDNEIVEFLSRFEVNSYLKIVLLRKSLKCGRYLSWKVKLDTSIVNSLCLTPLWMVSGSDLNDNDLSMFKSGDILQLKSDNCKTKTNSINSKMSVKIIRLDPSSSTTNAKAFEDQQKRSQYLSPVNYRTTNHIQNTNSKSKYRSVGSPDLDSYCLLTGQSLFPVLPVKQKLHVFSDTYSKSSHRPISDYNLSQLSNISVSSAPPVPPRSSTSLQYSFMENMDHPNVLHINNDSVGNREFDMKDSEKLNLSVQSAIQFNFHNSMNATSRELMSASFNCTSEFSTHKIPKLGKCRKVTLTVPSKIFCLKDLGLHLLHGKTEEAPVSKSDVDVSVINQIFIRTIDFNSIAHSAGLVEGDEIITINNHPVSKMTAEDVENAFLTNSLKPDRQKYSLLIKAQFNPLKMHELFKEKDIFPFDPYISSVRFTRSMYDDTNFSRGFHDNSLSHRLHVIRSSSNLNVTSTEEPNSTKLKQGVVCHLKTHSRTVRINIYTVLKLIKIIGGSSVGIFVSNIVYKDSDSEINDKESIGNRLAIGDQILEVNGENFEHMIGDMAVSTLNNLSHQTVLKVLYNPSGLLTINSDPFCQERFYMKTTFSFSELDNSLTTFSGKREKAASVCSRLDDLVVNIQFLRNFHLSFEKDDMLLVDSTILPASMMKPNQPDKNAPTYWHAWVVDKLNNKIRSGMIPSAFWIERMLSIHSKSFKFPISDNCMKYSLRSTPSSPISETTKFLSSPSSSFQNDSSKSFHTHHSSLGQKIFSRISFKNHVPTKTLSSDDPNKGIHFKKFIPIKHLPRVTSCKRPLVLLGPHADTFAMILASTKPQEYIIEHSPNSTTKLNNCTIHHIITVTSKGFLSELHQNKIYPIVILLNYKSPKQIRQLRICKTSQIKVSKSDCNKLFSLLKDYERNWSHIIHGSLFPSHVSNTCAAIVERVETVQSEDIWLPIDQYEYSE